MAPPLQITTTQWAREFRFLSNKSSAKPGRYNPDLTPWVEGMHEALDDSQVRKVVCMKSAQVAWTDGVLNNFIGKTMDVNPCPMIGMFAKEEAAKSYDSEKFRPMVEATQRLQTLLPAFHKSRDRDNRWAFKGFPGGFLKFVGSKSAASVKSTPAAIVFVEEPDDCEVNIDGQGDTITLLEERTKTYPNSKVVFGGTPTIDGTSRIHQAYLQSDQRKFYVPCHHCGDAHVLSWQFVLWHSDNAVEHEVFGHANPSTAYYSCPHCGGVWTDADKNNNVRRAKAAGFGWRATADFYGIAGFYINELYSPFPDSRLASLAQKYLAADHALRQGDDSKMRSFRNNSEGLPYAYSNAAPSVDELEKAAKDYEEWTVPFGAQAVTAGVDVQHDRLAIVVRAWGAGERSWLVYAGEIYGPTVVYGQGAWTEFEDLIDRTIPAADGATLKIIAGSIDCSDGVTSDAVYAFVRTHKAWRATKGSSSDTGDREIFTPPKAVEYKGKLKTKADKFGIKVFMVGTIRAKDVILGTSATTGRLRMQSGPTMHVYKTVRPDYFEQVVNSEVKVPHKTVKGRFMYQRKSAVRNEFLDCEVLALHAARAERLHLKLRELTRSDTQDLFATAVLPSATQPKPPVVVKAKKSFWGNV